MGSKKLKRSSSPDSSSPWKKKKFMIYAILGIVIIVGVSSFIVIMISSGNDSNMPDASITTENTSSSKLVFDSQRQSIEKFVTQFCGSGTQANSNDYVIEYVLPERCEMPLGIAVNADDDNSNSGTVWYISTKNGTLGRFDIGTDEFSNELQIPSWPSKENPISSSQVWDIEIETINNYTNDISNIWFTDEKQNAIWKYFNASNTFEIYYVPERSEAFGTTYPVSIELDKADDKVYFVGIRSPAIWVANISEMKNGTSEGIEKINIPINAFKGIIDSELISTGSIALDSKNDVLWISLLAFNTKGQIFRYDLQNKTFRTYDLPPDIRSPVGLAIGYSDDSSNNNASYVWGTDHATSIFFRLDPSTGQFTKFATSQASPRIYSLNSNITSEATYTLPYWIKSSNSNNSTIWFNEHTGNKIARFEPTNNTLVEYWIPTQNPLWGSCPDDNGNSSQCGIANALQFDVDAGYNGNTEVWFTEWTENKIGKILAEKPLPFSIEISSPQSREITIERGDTAATIQLEVEANMGNVSNVEMLSSGSFSPSGAIVNATGIFSEQTLTLQNEGDSRQVSFYFSPQANLRPGNYTLMLGAETESVSLLKGINVKVI